MKCKTAALGSGGPFPCRSVWNVPEIPNGEGDFTHQVVLESQSPFISWVGVWDDASLCRINILPLCDPADTSRFSLGRSLPLCHPDIHSMGFADGYSGST